LLIAQRRAERFGSEIAQTTLAIARRPTTSEMTVNFRQQCMISWNNHALLPKAYGKEGKRSFRLLCPLCLFCFPLTASQILSQRHLHRSKKFSVPVSNWTSAVRRTHENKQWREILMKYIFLAGAIFSLTAFPRIDYFALDTRTPRVYLTTGLINQEV